MRASDPAIRSALDHVILIKAHLLQLRESLTALEDVGHSPRGVVLIRRCMLDVRMVFEELMLLSVSAHGEAGDRVEQSLRKKHRADLKIRGLNELNPNFFPDAIDLVASGEPGVAGRFASVSEPYLTVEQAKRMYFRSDQLLHASRTFMSAENFEGCRRELVEFYQLAERLLRTFEIDISGTGFMVFGHLNIDDDALPQVFEAQRS